MRTGVATPFALVMIALLGCGSTDDDSLTDAGAGDLDARDGDAALGSQDPSGIIRIRETRWGKRRESYAFAEFHRGAPGTSRGFVEFMTEVASEGDCRYYQRQPVTCDPACPADYQCLPGNLCRERFYQDVGSISVAGTAVDFEMPYEGFYGTHNLELPDDLFAEDSTIAVSATGSIAKGFSVQVGGAAPLDVEFPDGVLTVDDDVDKVITWTPGAEGSLIWFFIGDTYTHGGSPENAIECSAPDTGSLTIPGQLVAMMPALEAPNCVGLTCTAQTIRRFVTTTVEVGEGQVTVDVGTQLFFDVNH